MAVRLACWLRRWVGYGSFLLAIVLAGSAIANVGTQELILAHGSGLQAELVAVTGEGLLEFRTSDGIRTVSPNKLVRWSTPLLPTAASELHLIDGSRLALADAWLGESALEVTAEQVSATSGLLKQVTFPRELLRAVVLGAPALAFDRARRVDQLLNLKGPGDRLLLANDDRFAGQLVSVTAEKTVLFETDLGRLEFEERRVAGIACPKQDLQPRVGTLAVGLQDGSYLLADKLVADADRLVVHLAGGIKLVGANVSQIASLQPFGPAVTYLSDLQPADYQHVPYLDIPWPWRADRNVLGGPLVVAGRMVAKGLGTHSASRLTYQLNRPDVTDDQPIGFNHFAAELAIDDAADGQGSAVFRVYLLQQGIWQLAHTSDVLRGGQAPVPVEVELRGAEAIALETDYADQGDQRDYANWLDARFISGPAAK